MMMHLKFLRSDVNQAAFFCCDKKSVTIVLVHVDDCTITASLMSLINNFNLRNSQHVEITNLGELHWLLGIEVKHDCKCQTIHLSQCSYIDSILRRYGLQDLKPVSIPMDTNSHLTTAQCPSTTAEFTQMRDVPYCEAVGLLMYAALGMCPNIAFAIQTISCFSTKPDPAHWEQLNKFFIT